MMAEENNPRIESSLKCDLCNKTFTKRGNLNKHNGSVHVSIRKFKCDRCDKTYKLKQHLNKHIGIFHDKREDLKMEKEYCVKCKKQIFFLKRHEMMVHEKKFRCFCQICNKSYSTTFNLKKHISLIHEKTSISDEKTSKSVMKMQCEICNKNFSRKDSIMKHMKATHDKIKNFQCEFCDRMFDRKDKLNEHIRVHTGVRDYKCKFCEKDYVLKKHLIVHIKRCHNKTKNNCEICLKEFPSIRSLRAHSKMNHSESLTEATKCDVCGKYFYNVKEHMVIHQEGNEIECDICGRSYLFLEEHMKTQHKERPKTKCEKCGKLFLINKSLTLHNCRFQCKICDEGFSSNRYLEKHILDHKHACMICFIEFSSSDELNNHIKCHQNGEKNSNPFEEIVDENGMLALNHVDGENKNFSEFRIQKESLDVHEELKESNYIITNFTQNPKLMPQSRFENQTSNSVLDVEKEFPNSEELYSGPSAYICAFCDQFFAYRRDYKKHIDSHKGYVNNIVVTKEPKDEKCS